MSNLPLDVSRCNNDECPLRNDCERYLQRDTGRVKTRYEYFVSKVLFDSVGFPVYCDEQIKPKQDETNQ